MEEELKCSICKQFFTNPVLLPCYHSLCLNCALHIQQSALTVVPGTVTTTNTLSTSSSDEDNLSDQCPLILCDNNSDVDKVSMLSETDSGAVCSMSSSSRPNSYVGTPNIQFAPLHNNVTSLSLKCPLCQKIVYFDDNGAHNLLKNRAMQNIVDKYFESKNLSIKCQLCVDSERAEIAEVMCEQCEVFYCEACREACHPARGPLAKHSLVQPQQGRHALRNKNKGKQAMCNEHSDETLGMYCLSCKVPVCAMCLQEERHVSHDVQALSAMCKEQKTELSQNLQSLSEKAKVTTEFIQRLKLMTEKLTESCKDVENAIAIHCDQLREALRIREAQLIAYVRHEKDFRSKTLKEQVGNCTLKLQQTTGLLQFCIEALKETEPTSFLQVGGSLIHRVSMLSVNWQREMPAIPQVAPDLDFTLDDKPLHCAIQQLNFAQLKPLSAGGTGTAPAAPLFIPEECWAENNSVTLAWQPPHPLSACVDGYILELDDGSEGPFREVYCGKESICNVTGLHFSCLYNCRVKGFNSTGEGDYSELLCLQTAEVAWFQLDSNSAHPEIQLRNENMTATCDSYEHRVVLGSIGFSKGIHYWEISIDRYDNDSDPAFGIARFDVSKDLMLGKDDKGWSMYIDHQRSWFLHSDKHLKRTEGGIEEGSVIGVLLDLHCHRMKFYVNQEPQGLDVSFSGLHGVFYPAISINRSVEVTLHTALDPPVQTDSDTSVDP